MTILESPGDTGIFLVYRGHVIYIEIRHSFLSDHLSDIEYICISKPLADSITQSLLPFCEIRTVTPIPTTNLSMKKFWSTSAKVHSLLSTRLGLYYANDSPATFPRFSELPAELRDQIWIHSLEQRVIPLHLRQYPHDESSIEISTLTGNEEIGEAMHENVIVAQNDEVTTSDMTGGEGEEGSTTADSEQDEANSESTEGDNGIDREYQLFTMAILTCSMEGRCKCNYLPPSKFVLFSLEQ